MVIVAVEILDCFEFATDVVDLDPRSNPDENEHEVYSVTEFSKKTNLNSSVKHVQCHIQSAVPIFCY